MFKWQKSDALIEIVFQLKHISKDRFMCNTIRKYIIVNAKGGCQAHEHIIVFSAMFFL